VKEAQGLGLDVKETQVQEKGGIVPGLGVNESITRWAFKSSVGAVGEPFSIPNGHAVFVVSEAKDAGVKSLDEVKESIRPLAVRKKKMETIKEIALALKAKLAPADSLTRLADFNPAVKAQRTGTFTLAGTVPGVGRDPNFHGAVSGLALGQISTPVQAFRGVYLIQLLYRSAFDSAAYATQRESMRTQMLQEKRNRFLTDWLAKLKESASIEDNREMFYR
jgi:peptidyl-prolyl cis-trans isomerase D